MCLLLHYSIVLLSVVVDLGLLLSPALQDSSDVIDCSKPDPIHLELGLKREGINFQNDTVSDFDAVRMLSESVSDFLLLSCLIEIVRVGNLRRSFPNVEGFTSSHFQLSLAQGGDETGCEDLRVDGQQQGGDAVGVVHGQNNVLLKRFEDWIAWRVFGPDRI